MKKSLLIIAVLIGLASCKKERDYECESSYTNYVCHYDTVSGYWVYQYGNKQTSSVIIIGNDELIDDYIYTNSRPLNNTGDSADVLIEVVCKEI